MLCVVNPPFPGLLLALAPHPLKTQPALLGYTPDHLPGSLRSASSRVLHAFSDPRNSYNSIF